MAAPSAQEKLIQGIVMPIKAEIDALRAEFKNHSAQTSAEFATLNASLMAVLARNEATQSAQAGGKKAARGEKKTGAAPAANGAAPAANGAADTGVGKVRNALLYSRHAMANNADFRAKYSRANAEKDATVAKLTPGTEKYWQALGAACWNKGYWTPEEKEAVKAEYEAWKQQKTRGAAAPNLDAAEAPSADSSLDDIANELGV